MIEDDEEEEEEEGEGVAMQVECNEEEESVGFGGDLKRKLPVELVSQDEPSKKKKKKKRGEKCLVCGEKGHRKMDCSRLPEERRKELQDLFNMKVGERLIRLFFFKIFDSASLFYVDCAISRWKERGKELGEKRKNRGRLPMMTGPLHFPLKQKKSTGKRKFMRL